MNATQFNREYEVGSVFVLSSKFPGSDGKAVRTVAAAEEVKSGTVVEISLEPWFANIRNLKPAN